MKMKTVQVTMPDGTVEKKRGQNPPRFAVIGLEQDVVVEWQDVERDTPIGPVTVRVAVGATPKPGSKPAWKLVCWCEDQDEADAALGLAQTFGSWLELRKRMGVMV